jgi:polysaccharide biosynthesis protein PelA
LLRSVKDQLSAASLAALTPVSANRYAAIVDGFFSARIDRVGTSTWRISDRGALQTVRFDAVEGREVDLQSSVGVIGQKRNGPTLYVALDETIEPAVVALTPPAPSRMESRSGLGLVESRWLARHVVKDDCALRFEAQGYGDGSFTWSGAASSRYIIAVDRAGQEVWRRTAEPDNGGRLKFVLPVSAIDPVTVRINCTSAARSTE